MRRNCRPPTANSSRHSRLTSRALRWDDSISDKAASAVDWFAYGRFLDPSSFSERRAHSCMVKADPIAESLPKSPFPASVAGVETARKAAWTIRGRPAPRPRKHWRFDAKDAPGELVASDQALTPQ